MPNNRITPVLSNYIGDLRREGKSAQQIGQILHLPVSTVKFHIQRQRSGQPVHAGSTGRPRCTNNNTDNSIVLGAKRERMMTNTQLAA